MKPLIRVCVSPFLPLLVRRRTLSTQLRHRHCPFIPKQACFSPFVSFSVPLWKVTGLAR